MSNNRSNDELGNTLPTEFTYLPSGKWVRDPDKKHFAPICCQERTFLLTPVDTVVNVLISMMNSHGLMMTCLNLMQPKLVKS